MAKYRIVKTEIRNSIRCTNRHYEVQVKILFWYFGYFFRVVKSSRWSFTNIERTRILFNNIDSAHNAIEHIKKDYKEKYKGCFIEWALYEGEFVYITYNNNFQYGYIFSSNLEELKGIVDEHYKKKIKTVCYNT